MTWHWNVRTSFNVIRSLVDRFQYRRADRQVYRREASTSSLDIDFENEIIDNVAGRFNWVGGFEKPAHFRGQQTTIGIKVVDEEQAEEDAGEVRGQVSGAAREAEVWRGDVLRVRDRLAGGAAGRAAEHAAMSR